MKIISLNVEKDLHNEAVLKFIKNENADIVCLQEFLEDDIELYKKELGMEAMYQTCRYETYKNYPRHIGKKQGVVILAKNIVNSGYEFYVGKEESTNKPFSLENFETSEALIWADTQDYAGEIFRVVCLHLPVTKDGSSTPYQLEALDKVFEKIEPLGEFILCGDMNAPRGLETFNKLAEKYKDNIPAEYKTSLDGNLHRVGPEKFVSEGMDQYMVDGLFSTSKYEAREVRLVDGLSDHMAIVGEIIVK